MFYSWGPKSRDYEHSVNLLGHTLEGNWFAAISITFFTYLGMGIPCGGGEGVVNHDIYEH